jgi:polar amino acid transport system substrate-binding protein
MTSNATTSAAPPPAPGLADLIAPTGTLRVVINFGNPVLAQGTVDEPRGVSVAIAHAVAGWLSVPLELHGVDRAGDAYATIAAGRVDVCFLANEPAREEAVAFTAPYVIIEGVYVTDSASPLTSSDQVDRAGVRIGVREGSAYDLFLTRTINHADVIRASEATDVFEEQGLDVAAGVRQPMDEYVAATGRRILEPPFMQIKQAVGLPRAVEPSALAAVALFVEHLVASSFVRDELARSGVVATVAHGS